MSQPKVVHSLFLLLFFGVVTGGIFLLLSMQLSPLLDEMGNSMSTTSRVMAEASLSRPTPTPTMPDLTLDMVSTLPPTPLPTSATPVVSTLLPTTATAVRMGVVNSDLVNLRSYPSLAGEVVGQAKQGERFEIVGTSNDGLWVQICCPLGSSEATNQSWVAIEFIVLEPSPASAQATVPTPAAPAVVAANQASQAPGALRGIVNSAMVNLRSGPDTTYTTVGQVSEQTVVTITGRNATGTWWRICCPPGAQPESWVSAEFIDLEISKEAAIAQIVPVSVP